MRKVPVPEGAEWFRLENLVGRYYTFRIADEVAVCTDRDGKVVARISCEYDGNVEFREFCSMSRADLITVFGYLAEEIVI